MSPSFRTLLARRRSATRRADHLQLGERGEQVALEYLKQVEGYRVVATNFVAPLGRGLSGRKITGEIDIIAYEGRTLAFVEVKTRTSGEVAMPERAIDLRKQRQIVRTARRYRQLMGVTSEPYRYDVVTVMPDARGFQIELLRGYFDDGVFRRARYFRRDF